MWGSLLLALSIIDLAAYNLLIDPATYKLPGLLGWVLNFAGMAYEYFQRLAARRKQTKMLGE